MAVFLLSAVPKVFVPMAVMLVVASLGVTVVVPMAEIMVLLGSLLKFSEETVGGKLFIKIIHYFIIILFEKKQQVGNYYFTKLIYFAIHTVLSSTDTNGPWSTGFLQK